MKRALSRLFGCTNPRIGVAALNPHASDGGIFGNEEKLILEPAIATARNLGVGLVELDPVPRVAGNAAGDDVEYDANADAVKFRREMERAFGR